tara:strand:+ start:125 stop:247 length:123 start_codon:yes stop_codon:yes gene_type:complete
MKNFILIFILFFLFLASCGKKGDPQYEAKKTIVEKISLIQ